MLLAYLLKLSVQQVLVLIASAREPVAFPILSRIMPSYSFSDHYFFRADGAPEHVARTREAAFAKLLKHWNSKWPRSLEYSAFLRQHFSDVRFAAGNRVFLPFKRKLDTWCDPCTVTDETQGPDIVDVDGHKLLDVAGSYGVNVCGYDMYKKVYHRRVGAGQGLWLRAGRGAPVAAGEH